MKTHDRLTQAYEHACLTDIDEHSSYCFFSDCHRGDGSFSDEFLKNKNVFMAALEYYYHNDFVYVEAGDGDELWEYKKFKHIYKANEAVFEWIKKFHDSGRLRMLYGNHNMQLKDPEYVQKNLFRYEDEYTGETLDFLPGIKPCEALLLRFRKTGQEILVVHGHQGDFPNDQIWYLSLFSMRFFWRYMHAFGFRNPSSPTKNINKQHKVERNYLKWIQKNQIALICGHTHRQKFPRTGELPYFNTGSCVFPSNITCIEITHGFIQLVGWQITVNSEGYLHAMRRILYGPEPLETFHTKRLSDATQTSL